MVACTAVMEIERHLCRMCINGRNIIVLLDLDSLVTLVKGILVGAEVSCHREIVVACVHENTGEYPVAKVTFET